MSVYLKYNKKNISNTLNISICSVARDMLYAIKLIKELLSDSLNLAAMSNADGS